MPDDHYVDYSQLLSQLLNDQFELNDTVISFLYHLFPGELFVKAMSLLDSNDMFIYVFDKAHAQCEHSESTETEPDGSGKEAREPQDAEADADANNFTNSFSSSHTDNTDLVSLLYKAPETVLYRLVVKPETAQGPPICVDLDHWFCSCEEYGSQFQQNFIRDTSENREPSIYSRAVTELNASASSNSDRFAQLPLQHNVQRYFRHELVLCPHLLAFAILLQTSSQVLTYFTQKNATVYLITVQHLDEWLKLHLNMIQ
ncbi:LANO_0F03488g1_1 [Lachancea nothofagi CBS 11611]|uniref:LANO_0F03488g1_1 n=1 Tax=Lachancea nothofagi CBS 11611 TaxID=1266666 RepID=A0A1G4K751_9SACH|nr:LANO_0F03488g1_1 [Lachancea nothofagi CBS 11611]